jgi:phage-related baseplate assembly protein
VIDLAQLPPVTFAGKDPTVIESAVITAYEALAGKTLYPGDPVRLFLEAVAYIIAQQRQIIDFAGKQNLLAYASDGYIEHIGALLEVPRKPASAATTTLRFTISAPQAGAVTIPAGTRATPGGTLLFVTTAAVDVAAGKTSATVPAECTTEGTKGNGFLPGQIKIIVDPFPWFKAVENVTTSSGGADQESLEDYRRRIQEAPESFSTAGPEGAYAFWAKSASQSIADVAVVSPQPGMVDIRVLMAGGELPTQDILDAVLAICSDKTKRPLTDKVVVKAPDVIPFDIDLTYYIYRDKASMAVSTQTAVQQAVQDWLSWQTGAIGLDINPSELIRRVQEAGAKRVAVAQPVFTPVAKSAVAQLGTMTVRYGGIE